MVFNRGFISKLQSNLNKTAIFQCYNQAMTELLDPPESPASLPKNGQIQAPESTSLDSIEKQANEDPIRRMAINRIIELEKELESYGYKARCGMEVEFFVDGEPGRPVEIPEDKLAEIRERLAKSRYVEDLREENVQRSWSQPVAFSSIGVVLGAAGTLLTGNPLSLAAGSLVGVGGAVVHAAGMAENGFAGRLTKAAQYEINLGDTLAGTTKVNDKAETRTQRHRLGPLKAAIATDYFQKELASMLSDVGDVNYTAKPRRDNLTSAMHINVSLSDKNGNNLFTGKGGGESPLMTAALSNLVEVQKQGSLMFLPNQNSHDRIHNGRSTPDTIGRQSNKVTYHNIIPAGTADSRNAGWVGRASGFLHGSKVEGTRNRIENRMSGADADPYLAVAATLGAMVITARQQAEGVTTPKVKRHSLPGNLSDSVREFEKSDLMKEVLGSELHDALVERYAMQASSQGMRR